MDEFKDDNQKEEQPEELRTISKVNDPGYDPDDDVEFQVSPVAAALLG